MEKRNQHYIPQFYLNYFTDPLIPVLYSPYVWIYDKKKELIKNKAPKNIAYEKGYNDIVDSEGHISSIVEDQFREIEYNASKVFKKITQLENTSEKERIDLSKFVFSMIERVPKFRELFKEIIESGEVEELADEDNKYDNVPSDLKMDGVVRVTHLVSHLLLRMDWSLFIAPSGSNFITSDNPVVIKDPSNLNVKMCGIASSPKVEVTFPLTRLICLFGSWGRYRKEVEKISADEVSRINFETFKYSHRFLISSSKYIDKRILLVNHLVNKGRIH